MRSFLLLIVTTLVLQTTIAQATEYCDPWRYECKELKSKVKKDVSGFLMKVLKKLEKKVSHQQGVPE